MTRPLGTLPRRGAPSDAGFTLIEVIVALVLLGLVATAVLMFFVRGMQATSHLQRSQSADAVAAQAMERVRAVPARPAPDGTGGVLAGRARADVLASWSVAASIDTADSTAVWDPAATTSASAAVPLETDEVRSGLHYTVTTLIGECYRLASRSGTDQACTKVNPGAAVRVFRVTVVVRWKPTSAGACAGGALCTFRMSSLVDPSPESNWNLTSKPVAYDDQITMAAGSTGTDYEILANDVIGAVTSNPVTKLSGPAFGTASIITSGTSMGMLRYTPPAAASGRTSLTYMLRDAAGRTSDAATVAIWVVPAAKDDSVAVTLGGAVQIDVAANDLGTFAPSPTITIVSPPSVGTATVLGGLITYQAPPSGSPSGSPTSFTYTVTDTSSQVSAPATVSISLVPAVAPAAFDPTLPVATDDVRAVAYSEPSVNVGSNDVPTTGMTYAVAK